MKPIIIVPPDTMSDDDIARLNANDLCVVVASDPSKVRFLDPLPAASSRTEMENAAIELSRLLLHGRWGNWSNMSLVGRETFAQMYVDLLTKGSPLDKGPTRAEQEEDIYASAKADELRRMAREEAREERKKKKAVKPAPAGSDK